MNQIVKENYEENYLIAKIIEKLPKYFILKEELKDLFKAEKENDEYFTVNSLVSIFEYFEDLCWDEIKKNIDHDY